MCNNGSTLTVCCCEKYLKELIKEKKVQEAMNIIGKFEMFALELLHGPQITEGCRSAGYESSI